MAEKSFDALLRQALLEANWQEWQPLWETAAEPDFSPAYRRWRLRLLSDPFGWMKKHLRPLWAKVLRTAACLLVASAVALGSLMAVSPTVRAAVLNWLREISGNLMTYSTDRQTETDVLPSNWRITWMPENWGLQDMTTSFWKYQENSGKGNLLYGCYAPGSTDLTTNVDDVSDAEAVRETIQVQGTQADYYESDGYQVLLWENEEGFLFMLRGDFFLDREDFLKIAESVAYYDGSDVAYQLEWIPGDYEPVYRYELIGAVEEEWSYNKTSLTWRYVTDPICEFLLPDGEPEEVTVGGAAAQYWAASEPLEASDSASSITVGDIVVTVSKDPGADQTGTLLWTDPDTNTTFLLEGALEGNDLVHMAESMVRTTPNPSAPSHHAALMEGTAGG